MTTAADVVRRFVDAVNAGDADAVAGLLTEDHRFVDSLGAEVAGREAMRDGWREYFRIVPDYHIEIERIVADGQLVVVLGVARGTYRRGRTPRPEDAWETPAAWRARVEGGRVAEWQVYADNEPVRRKQRGASS